MSNPSNLYAEKIFSEHPSVLWALDDKADYVSLITEAQRDMGLLWQGPTGGSTPTSTPSDAPFQDSWTTIIYADVPASNGEETIVWSPNLANLLDLDTNLETVSVGTYFYSNSIYVSSISIGIEYTDPETSTVVRQFQTFDSPIYSAWSFISGTFDVPQVDAPFRIVIKFTTITGGVSTDDYEIFFNGITAGQWAEEFHATSLGTTVSTFPIDIALLQDYAVETVPYGLQDINGYYLASETSLFAKNTSIPLVYGASGVTKITENIDNPSLIIPGQGFLNELGRYGNYTVEFWARINSDTSVPRRIFGPISSLDGIYVEAGFITLKIGNAFRSHFVGEWYRPMLINIRVIKNSASLLINGEEVLSLSFDTESLYLPSIVDSSNGKSQDWLGFYAYSDVPEIEIDCVAIYPYQVPITLAKRRWVYGQAVESPEGINSAYGGTSAFIDYTFSDYTANYTYPGFAKWRQGNFDNLVASTTTLQTPQYSLPDISIGSKTITNFYDDNLAVQVGNNKFITFRPNETWSDVVGYFNFANFDIINDEVHAVYAVIQINEDDLTEQTIIEIKNTVNGNKFSIRKDGSHIDYYLTFNGVEEEILMGQEFPIGLKIAVGINIQELVNNFGGNVSSFFGNRNGLTMYVGGDDSDQRTFTGYLYSVGLSTTFNKSEISDYFQSNGIAIMEASDELLIHTASYTLLPTEAYDTFYLDIGVSGHWQDYMPLSYFAQYVKNDVGNEYYDLDFIQFNVDYPEPLFLTEANIGTESFSYQDLDLQYSLPTQQTYEDLINGPAASTLSTFVSGGAYDESGDLVSAGLYNTESWEATWEGGEPAEGWANYLDLSEQYVKKNVYNTENANVKSYVTFQYLAEGANAPLNSFAFHDKPLEPKILDIAENTQWAQTKFEIVNNMLIYPDKTLDFNELAIVYHLEFNTRGILTKPISLRNLSLASQVLNNNSFNPIGTKFGNNLFPYTKSGIYYDYKSKNPFSIYKGSTPYLYMTRNSGIEVRGDFSTSIDRGISLPINTTLADKYRISAFQTWYRNDNSSFSSTPVQLFEINYKNETIQFYVVATNAQKTRARIFGINSSTGEKVNGLSYYINGLAVREPVLTIKEWSIIGISFASPLIFDLFLGSININGSGVFNNISHYQATDLQQIRSVLTRPWANVKTEDGNNFDWQYWDDNYSWNGMLVLSTSSAYGVNPSDIYKTYIGTNKIIIDDNEGMILDSDKLKIYDAVEWSSSVITAI
jgi:hypothetical protein